MSFYNELLPYIEYLHSIRKFKDYLSFDMKFPPKWVLPKNFLDSDTCIPFELNGSNHKGISFTTEINQDKIDSALNKIRKIIKINEEKEHKEKLFRDYVERLKITFEKNDIEKLEKLYFEFEEIPELKDNEYESDGQESEIVELVNE